MSQEIPSGAIDNGSCTYKAGFGGEDKAGKMLHPVVGYPRCPCKLDECGLKEYIVGNEVKKKRCVLNLNYPIEHGLIKEEDEIENSWHYALFFGLRVAPKEYAVLLTQLVDNSKKNREEIVQTMLKALNIPALIVVNQAALSLFDSGRVTGISVNIGHSISQVVPIYEASTINHAAIQWHFAGHDLTDYFKKILTERGYMFNDSTSDRRVITDIKEKLCYVALDFEQEMQIAASSKSLEKSYKQTDGQVITIGNERFRVPEALFQSSFVGKKSDGVHKITYNSIMKCDEKMRKDMFANIVLSGGSTMFPGFVDRMKKEMCALAPPGTEVNIIALTERKYSTLTGGSKMTSTPPSED